MVQSIIDDIREQFRSGNMITRLILINLFVMLILVVIKAFSPPSSGTFDSLFSWVALPGGGWSFITRPWTLLSYSFTHIGLWHFGWNMLMLYWFGKIVGDLIGDNKIVPIYVLGAVGGGILFLLYAQFAGWSASTVHGASGAVMAFVVAAGFLAPDYIIHLLLIGPVRLKYVSATLVLIDIVMMAEQNNPGGRAAHLGGAIMGGLFVYLMRRGVDLSEPFQRISSPKPKRGSAPMKVVHNKKRPSRVQDQTLADRAPDVQEKIDIILDKINASGYDSLTAAEKDFLYQASKN